MNWLINIVDEIKWKIQDFVWTIQDKFKLEKELFEEVEVKPKKKKAKKKTKNKK